MSLTQAFVCQVADEYGERGHGWADNAAGRSLTDMLVCVRGAERARRDDRARSADRWHRVGDERGRTLDDDVAALAVAAHELDRDDVHWPTLTHPGGVVWPVVVALGTRDDVPGSVAVRAATVGYEIMVRLALGLGDHHRSLWHVTTTCGTVGATVAAALVAGGSTGEAVDAAAHAVSVAGGSVRALHEGSGTRLFHRAHAVRTALHAWAAASGGLKGTAYGLESPEGLFAATGSPTADPTSVLRGHESWAIQATSPRLYAANGFSHTAVSAAARLVPEDPSELRDVEISLAPGLIPVVGDTTPTGPAGSWRSAPCAVAATLAHGDPWALERGLAAITPPLVAELIARTRVTPLDGGGPLTARVRTTACTGDVLETVEDHPPGHPLNPLAEGMLATKWMHLAGLERPVAEGLVQHAGSLGSTSLRQFVGEVRERLGVSRRGSPR